MPPQLLFASAMLLAAGASVWDEHQNAGRAFVVLVDDARYAADEVQSAGRLLGLLRDEVFTARDLVSIVSTGMSSVETELRYMGDRRNLNGPIRRIVTRPPSMTVMPAAVVDAAQLRYDAYLALLTARHVVERLAQLKDRPKHLVLLTSGATSAVVLGAALASERASGEPSAPAKRSIEPAALMRGVAELAAAARHADVTMHTLDVRDPASLEVLRQLK